MNESEVTEEIKTFLFHPYLLPGYQALSNCKPISAGCPGDVRYLTCLLQPVCVKYQSLFSGKNKKKKYSKCLLLQFIPSMPSVTVLIFIWTIIILFRDAYKTFWLNGKYCRSKTNCSDMFLDVEWHVHINSFTAIGDNNRPLQTA